MSSDGSPRVIVTGQWRAPDGKLRVPIHYLHALKLTAATPVVASRFDLRDDEMIPDALHDLEIIRVDDPMDDSVLADAAGLLVPGGGDVDPAWYGQERHHRTKGVSHERDEFEETLLEAAIDRNMPTLCICHGMQILNVMLGGTLDQHLADTPERIEHDRDKPRAEPAHSIKIEAGSLLGHALGAEEAQVNSHHHQGIDELAGALQATAWSGDGVLEAVEARDHPWLVGVQWHPEVMVPVDACQRRLFEVFVETARSRAEERPVRASR